ncbi:MAG: hypothetical protein AAGC55_14530, partial [Myxococcota bacterium]
MRIASLCVSVCLIGCTFDPESGESLVDEGDLDEGEQASDSQDSAVAPVELISFDTESRVGTNAS